MAAISSSFRAAFAAWTSASTASASPAPARSFSAAASTLLSCDRRSSSPASGAAFSSSSSWNLSQSARWARCDSSESSWARAFSASASAANASEKAARTGPSCACASSRSRCRAASSRPTCSCCPEMSSSPRVAAWSCAAVASAPFTQARLRPSRWTVRRTTSSPPAAGSPSDCSRASHSAGCRGRKSACTSASSAPVRTESAWARPPNIRFSASTRMLFPAPVSPVSTLKPGAKCTSSSSMMANARTRSSSSIGGQNSRRVRHE